MTSAALRFVGGSALLAAGVAAGALARDGARWDGRGPAVPRGGTADDRGAAAAPRAPTPRVLPAPSAQEGLYQVPYNGAFTFTRVRYRSGRMRGFGGRRGSAWSHDYPDADRNLQTILDEFTSVAPNTRGSNVVDLENPEIFKHPILYVSEPGFWTIGEEGARNLRDFLLKGGFLIFDDFEANQWYNMAAQVARALPEGQWVEVDGAHPLFQGFFVVDDIYVPHPLVDVTPRYMVIFEDNDPDQRVMVLANHNSDLAEYWEWSPRGYFPVDPTNDAYRLGVNYIIYGLTH